MYDLIRDSFFGRVVYLLSRGNLFVQKEHLYPSLLDPYSAASSGSASEASVTLGTDLEKDHEKGHDYQLVDWADNDAENPRNWSTPKKFFVTFNICLLTTSIYIGSAIYTAGIEDITRSFGVSQVAATLGLTLFVVGYALGPMILAPMSEMPFFGRTSIYIVTLLIFVFLQLAVIYAKNFGMLLAFRFITGFIGSPVLATGGASIADMYAPKKQVYGIAVWGIAAVCGPALGPLVGGFAAENKGWQWPIWELMWLSGACFIFLVFFLPETSASNILYRRTIRYRKATGNANLKCQPEIEAEGMSGKEIAQMTLIRPFSLTFTEPICFALNLYLVNADVCITCYSIALIYALLYLWFESFPIVFIGIYGFSLGTQGLAFLGILLGAFVALPPFFWYVHRYMEPLFNEEGNIKPEYRLRPALVGCFFIPICLFWFGWSSRASVHWIMPIIGSSFFSIGAFCLFMAVLTYLGDAYPKYVASVYAGNDLVRSSFGAAFPLFANAMYRRLGIGWASSLLGFLSIAFIPIPFVLYFYGERIRRSSKMASHDL